MAAKAKQRKQQKSKDGGWHPKEDIIFMDVENPFYSRAHDAGKTNPRKITAAHNARESAITSMAARGSLSAAQVKAAKKFCHQWEAMGGAGAQAIDYTREPVDGGRNPEAITEQRSRAGKELKECRTLLGVLGYELVCKTAGMGLSLDDVAGRERRRRDHAADSLRGCLEVLAVHWGYSNAKIRGWAA